MRNMPVAILFSIMLLLVSGCGGGGGSPAAPNTVSGVAAAGAVITGDVYLKDSAATPKFLSRQTTDGSFSFDVTGLTKPFLLRVTGTAGDAPYTLYSATGDQGIANINPMSNLIVAYAATGADLAAIFAALEPSGVQDISGKLTQAVLDVQATLKTVLQEYQADTVNAISDAYQADHSGLDGMFDALDFKLDGTLVTILAGTDVVFTGDLATGFTTFAVTGRVTLAGAGLAGVTVRVEDAQTGLIYGTTSTTTNGSYSVQGIPQTVCAVFPSLSGYSFDRLKTELTVTGNSTVPDFTATAVNPPGPGTGGIIVEF